VGRPEFKVAAEARLLGGCWRKAEGLQDRGKDPKEEKPLEQPFGKARQMDSGPRPVV
jgi:hypothetical protein